MKKSLLVLVALFMMILIPGNVNAAKDWAAFTNCEEPASEGNKKVTVCQIGYESKTGKDFSGGTTTITFEPEVSSTTYEFSINKAFASIESEKGNKVTINVKESNGSSKIIIGEVKWIADKNEEDCGGVWSPTPFEGTDTGDSDFNDGEVVESGYAIPYIALAIGAVGVITVLATSKKKTKMYKI